MALPWPRASGIFSGRRCRRTSKASEEALCPGRPQGPRWSWRPPPPRLPPVSGPETSPRGPGPWPLQPFPPAPGISSVLSSSPFLGVRQLLRLEFCQPTCASVARAWAGSRSSWPGSAGKHTSRAEEPWLEAQGSGGARLGSYSGEEGRGSASRRHPAVPGPRYPHLPGCAHQKHSMD